MPQLLVAKERLTENFDMKGVKVLGVTMLNLALPNKLSLRIKID
jgi:hypothetical protein